LDDSSKGYSLKALPFTLSSGGENLLAQKESVGLSGLYKLTESGLPEPAKKEAVRGNHPF